MSSFFLYCSAEQTYNTLICNAILSRNNTVNSLRCASPSLLNSDYIFITKEKLTSACRNYALNPSGFSVTLELGSFEQSGVEVLFVFDDDGLYTLDSEFSNISKYGELENCIGALVFGYIPFSYVTHFIFETEGDMKRVLNASPDLWFPRDLFTTWSNKQYRSLPMRRLHMDYLADCASSAQNALSEKETLRNNAIISKMLRLKAGAYYFLEATEDWKYGKTISNIDLSLLHFLEYGAKQKTLTETVNARRHEIIDSFHIIDEGLLRTTDPVLEQPDSENGKMFHSAIRFLLENVEPREPIQGDKVSLLLESCNCSDNFIKSDELRQITSKIEHYINNPNNFDTDPDELASELKNFPVLQAVQVFLDCQKDQSFLRRGAKKLDQHARRYAYILFGISNGMFLVDGTKKSNRNLEYRLENVVSAYSANQSPIVAPPADYQENSNNNAGFTPNIRLGMSYDEMVACIQNEKDEKTLELLYLNNLKEVIPEESVKKFRHPIIITYNSTYNSKTQEKTLTIETPEQAEKKVNAIIKYISGLSKEYSSELIKNRLEASHYKMLFDKFCK